MASLSTDKNGSRTIQFVSADGKRATVRLGKVPLKAAKTVKVHIEHILAARTLGDAIDHGTAKWLADLTPAVANKLAKVGLVKPKGTALLESFIKEYLKSRTDIKPRTRNNLEQTRDKLVEFFGATKPMRDISPGDADEFRRWLLERLSENTARRHFGRARQYFRVAVRKRLLPENPFADMKDCAVKANKAREYFVTREEAAKVLEACPDAQWRLLFALSRYGGLRCPSEHLALTWAGVDWERSRIRVPSPKTKHHEGGDCRFVPSFLSYASRWKRFGNKPNQARNSLLPAIAIRIATCGRNWSGLFNGRG